MSRRFPIGAEPIDSTQMHFRVWAPKARRLDVAIEGAEEERTLYALEREPGGYFSGVAQAGSGSLYWLHLDGNVKGYPDPASRSQPAGPHGASCVVDPATFKWTDSAWRGVRLKGQVIYEMHVGTFTKEGTWQAAARELPELARLGITVIEMMPVAEFAGEFGWGYDGVDLFAPAHIYGTPDDLRSFIDEAHTAGVGVILDVVYNHFGPEGNYLRVFADDYFTDRYECEWGEPLNFDGPNSAPVREFFIANACYWVTEFHFDGFRFDATQSIFDGSDEYILAAISKRARAAAGDRALIFIAENEPQHTKLVRPWSEGGDGFDGLWNDDLHHSAAVALTGRNEAYYSDHRGSPQEFISAAKYGYLFQGQHYRWQKQPRGTPAFGIAPHAFVAFIENHDQIANSGFGMRMHAQTSPGRVRAMTALLLLGPWTPMLFQGEEFAASMPFVYFTDLGRELHEPVRKGRTTFLTQFPSIASEETRSQLADPVARETFTRCKLDFGERSLHAQIYGLHIDLIRLRKEEPAFRAQRPGGVDGAVLGRDSFVLRYFLADGDDRLLVINFGKSLHLDSVPEPLLAPPLGCTWVTLWTSELPRYGGPGGTPLETEEGWRIPAEAAVVLRPMKSAPTKKK